MWIKIFLKEYSVVFDKYTGVYSRVHEKQQTQTNRSAFHKDSTVLGELVIDELCEKSNKSYNLLYYFAKYNAKYDNRDVVNACIKSAKSKKIFTFSHVVKLRIMGAWGMLRPMVRRIYFKLFRKMKTQ